MNLKERGFPSLHAICIDSLVYCLSHLLISVGGRLCPRFPSPSVFAIASFLSRSPKRPKKCKVRRGIICNFVWWYTEV